MAAQTNSADDLIAELARLMAEDAQGDKPAGQPAPVRIPGGEGSGSVSARTEPAAPVSARPVRIPGGDDAANEPPHIEVERAEIRVPAAPSDNNQQRIEPALFAERRVEPASPLPFPPQRPVALAPQEPALPPSQPIAVEPEAELPALDQDTLASLIAAELAVVHEDGPADNTEPEEQPVEDIDVSAEVANVEAFPREVDAFGIPPVFGLGSAAPSKPELQPPLPAPVAAESQPVPPVQSHEPLTREPAKTEPVLDPLDEIERLIGPAAHVHQAPPSPSPALRSLATPTLPRDPVVTPNDAPPLAQGVHVSSVEEAILAAAATSGAKVEWVEPPIAARLESPAPENAPKAPRSRVLGMTRSLAGPLVATLLLAVAAVGLYTVLGLGSNAPSGPAPLVVADATPTKEIPEQAPDAASASQSVVFNEISGVNTGAEEQIVSRDQADLAAVTNVASTDFSQEGLVNRKVRTVTVRPDGTIVSGGDSVAGSAMLPVDRPTVPDVPGADFSTPDLIANTAPSAAAATPAPVEQPEPATPEVIPVVPGSNVPVVDLTGTPVTGKTAPVPLVRPTTFAPQSTPTQPVAAATPAPAPATTAEAPQVAALSVAAPAATTPAATPTVTGSAAPAYVQLSSQRSEEAARQTAQDIANRFGSLFGGTSLEVQRVDLGERGIFYRVRLPADSLQSANTICSSVKSNGGDCFTL